MGVTVDGEPRADVTAHARGSHVVSLPDLVRDALARASLELEAVDAVAVSIGPGSFTGLRIGLAFAKGLVFAGRARLVGVSTLEALAVAADAAGGTALWVAIDARKREVYAAPFVADGPGKVRRVGPDEAMAPAALAARMASEALLLGDAAGVYPELGGHGRRRSLDDLPAWGSIVARLGEGALAREEAVNPGEIEPGYLRLPDARLPQGPSR